MKNTRSSTHFFGVDLLRFFAASLVLVYHFVFWHWTSGQFLTVNHFPPLPATSHLFHFGWIGVEIFFVISGFVIALSAADCSSKMFARRRFMRLAPAAWICATIALVLHWQILPGGPHLLYDYAATLVFWPLRAVDPIYWTLGIEVSFYALVWTLLRNKREWYIERLMCWIGLASGLFWCAALILERLLDGQEGMLAILRILVLKAEGNRYLQLLLVQHGCHFAFGVVLYRVFVDGLTRQRLWVLAALTLACTLEIIGQNGIIARASNLPLSAVSALVVWACAMTIMAVCLRYNVTVSAWLGYRARTIRFMGLMTYPLYLLHNMVGLSVSLILLPLAGPYAIPLGVTSAVACAALVARFGEPTLRRALSRLWPSQSPPSMAQQAELGTDRVGNAEMS